jgi:hypothetical protein
LGRFGVLLFLGAGAGLGPGSYRLQLTARDDTISVTREAGFVVGPLRTIRASSEEDE